MLLIAAALFFLLITYFIVKRKRRRRKKIFSLLVLIPFFLCVTFSVSAWRLFKHNAHVRNLKQSVVENLAIHQGNYIFGIDISHYNGIIDWSLVKTSQHPIKFVFVRATMGKDGVDKRYRQNIQAAEDEGYIVGTYHYYRPNENSTEQFNHFKKHAVMKKGHLLPVLDIEEESRFGKENLRKGIQNWLNLAEQEYGVKPIIYTGRVFYRQNLQGYFNDYPLWIASYAPKSKLQGINWDFHQFSERVRVKGIDGFVDGNDFNGELQDLDNFRIP